MRFRAGFHRLQNAVKDGTQIGFNRYRNKADKLLPVNYAYAPLYHRIHGKAAQREL